jgi:hypothetical protein
VPEPVAIQQQGFEVTGTAGFDRKLLSIIASMPALRFAVDAEAGVALKGSNTGAVTTAAAAPPSMVLRVNSPIYLLPLWIRVGPIARAGLDYPVLG